MVVNDLMIKDEPISCKLVRVSNLKSVYSKQPILALRSFVGCAHALGEFQKQLVYRDEVRERRLIVN